MRPWAGQAAPATSAVAVTADDDNDLARVPTRGIYVGSEGSLQVVMVDGQTTTFAGVTAGTLLPIAVVRILEASTASSLVALY
jgi:hypothetical protein